MDINAERGKAKLKKEKANNERMGFGRRAVKTYHGIPTAWSFQEIVLGWVGRKRGSTCDGMSGSKAKRCLPATLRGVSEAQQPGVGQKIGRKWVARGQERTVTGTSRVEGGRSLR